MAIIDIHRVSFAYGATSILQDISLSVASGKTTVLLGPSGCGKSTLLRLIAGFAVPTRGRISIAGQVVSQDGRIIVPPERRQLGMVFQDLALWPHMTVQATLHFVLRAGGCPATERAARVRAMLTKAALDAVATAYPSQLSGGQRQLLALARALMTQPQVLLMDEPLASLDVALRERFIELLLRLVQEEHLSLLYVTHQQEEAFTLADAIIVMYQGRIEQTGTPEEVYHHPATAFVQRFIGVTNVLTGVVVADGQVQTPGGTGATAVQGGRRAARAAGVRGAGRHRRAHRLHRRRAPLHRCGRAVPQSTRSGQGAARAAGHAAGGEATPMLPLAVPARR